jgi:hypothetical protein
VLLAGTLPLHIRWLTQPPALAALHGCKSAVDGCSWPVMYWDQSEAKNTTEGAMSWRPAGDTDRRVRRLSAVPAPRNRVHLHARRQNRLRPRRVRIPMEPGASLLLDGEGPHGPLELLELPSGFWPWQQSSGISSARHRLLARTWRERLQSAGKTLVIATGQRVGPRRQKRHRRRSSSPSSPTRSEGR